MIGLEETATAADPVRRFGDERELRSDASSEFPAPRAFDDAELARLVEQMNGPDENIEALAAAAALFRDLFEGRTAFERQPSPEEQQVLREMRALFAKLGICRASN